MRDQGPVWLPEVNRLFFVSNRLGNQDTSDQHVELWTLDPTTLVTKQITPSIPLLMGNGATNWSPSEVLVLSQVCALHATQALSAQHSCHALRKVARKGPLVVLACSITHAHAWAGCCWQARMPYNLSIFALLALLIWALLGLFGGRQ